MEEKGRKRKKEMWKQGGQHRNDKIVGRKKEEGNETTQKMDGGSTKLEMDEAGEKE